MVMGKAMAITAADAAARRAKRFMGEVSSTGGGAGSRQGSAGPLEHDKSCSRFKVQGGFRAENRFPLFLNPPGRPVLDLRRQDGVPFSTRNAYLGTREYQSRGGDGKG
jgi:hypothetical protein